MLIGSESVVSFLSKQIILRPNPVVLSLLLLLLLCVYLYRASAIWCRVCVCAVSMIATWQIMSALRRRRRHRTLSIAAAAAARSTGTSITVATDDEDHHHGNRWWGWRVIIVLWTLSRFETSLAADETLLLTDDELATRVAELRQSVSCIVYGEHLLVLRTIRVLWDVFTATRFNRQTCTSYTDIVIFDITAAGCYVYNSSPDYLDMFPLMWRLHLKLSYAESRSHLLEESGWDSLLSIARQSFELASVQWVTLHVSSILFL